LPDSCGPTGWLQLRLGVCLLLAAAIPQAHAQNESPRPRARQLGLETGALEPGPHNAITDVAGVRVGHFTLRRPPRFNTGITAVLPHGGNLFHDKVPAAIVVGNGFGKLLGSTQVNELGEIETPILLTGTLNVPRVADALIGYMLSLPGMDDVRSINPVVGETNDGYLSDIRARPLGESEVRQAIGAAAEGPVAMGAVGAGTGTVCFGFKAGSMRTGAVGRWGSWCSPTSAGRCGSAVCQPTSRARRSASFSACRLRAMTRPRAPTAR
jgi:D-aminopeptidase